MTMTIDSIQTDDIATATPDITAASGHAPAPAPRPYWQDRPCPSWCMTGPHEDRDMPEDRCHISISREVTLTLEAANVERSQDGKVPSVYPGCFTAYLDQGWREREARVILSHNGTTGIEFTLAEAGELARALASLEGEDSARDEQCPSWCIAGPHTEPFIGDRNHIGDYTWVDLTLADPDVSYPPKPWPNGELPEPKVTIPDIGARLWQGWREREAYVDIVYRDEYTDLTLAEARELGEALSALVADATV